MHARNLYFGQEGQARDPKAAFDWLARSLDAGNNWAAGTLVAFVDGTQPEVFQADRDRALVVLA